MKTLYTLLLLLATPMFLLAQKSFHRMSIGAGAGITQMRGDLRSSQSKKVYITNAEYCFTPYFAGVLEAQIGTISGQDGFSNRYFNNSYHAGSGSLKMYMGQFLDRYPRAYHTQKVFYKVAQGLFASAGAGIIRNNQTDIYRQKDSPMYYGTNTNKDFFIPLSIGIDNSGFGQKVIAALRYQCNFVLGDQVDGYSIPGSKNDVYNTLTLNLKYKFGPTGIF